DGGRPARHGHRGEVAAALEGGQAGGQELTAPDRAVGAVAGPVEGHPDDRACRTVVGQAGGDVRGVVLDAFGRQVRLERVLGGQVLRVQVVRHDLGVDVEQPAEVLDALGEGAQRLGVLQVPDVRRDEGVAPSGQAERVLQLGTAGQHGAREPGGDGEGLGHVAAGAAEQHRAAAEAPGHRVVGPDVDGPVVGQERVGDVLQRVPGLVVTVDDRLVGDVSAGQYDWAGHGFEQQVVQRRV